MSSTLETPAHPTDDKSNTSSLIQSPIARSSITFLPRLNQLLSTTPGLDTTLAFLNYALILYAFFESSFSSSALPKSQPDIQLPQQQSSAYLLANLVSDFRTTLRLTYLIPLFNSLFLPLNTHPDPYHHSLFFLTTWTYVLYQLSENIAHLADHRVFLPTFTTLIPESTLSHPVPGNSDLWFLSNRLWHLGVSLDLISAARGWYFVRSITYSDAKSTSASSANPTTAPTSLPYQGDLLIASCWWPLTLHWSLRSGIWPVDDLAIGTLGTLASFIVLQRLWAATVEEQKQEELEGAKSKSE